MPQEIPANNLPSLPPTAKVITNDPRLAEMNLPNSRPIAATSGESNATPAERVELPSKGKIYAANNPASAGWVMVRPLTTVEEDILVTERYAKQGTTIDMILSRCILTKGINTMDLCSGDRVHLLFYLRAISYGPEYEFEARMRDGNKQMIKTDVSKLQIVTLPDNFQEPWIIQQDGFTYEVKLLRGSDEREITQETRAVQKKNPNAPDPRNSLTLKRQIVSINGSTDRDVINQHISGMVAGKAHKLRAEIAKINPGPNLRIEVINENTGEEEVIAIAITETFFRPVNEPG